MPFSGKKSNIIELINELFIQLAFANSLLFSGFVTDQKAKYLYGWTFVIIVMTYLVFNLTMMLKFSANSIKLVLLKLYNKFVRKKAEPSLEIVEPARISLEDEQVA